MNLGTVSASVVVSVAGLCGSVMGQSFPIRAAAEPVWPVDFGVESFYWDDSAWTLERAGDLNGDGVDDLVVLLASFNTQYPDDRRMWVYWGSKDEAGNLSLGTPDRIEGFELEGDRIIDFAIHDHDGDGLKDLVLCTSLMNSVEVWLNTGEGFAQGMALSEEEDGYVNFQRLVIEDIDGDGDADYLVSSCDASAVWTRGAGGVYSREIVPFVAYDEELIAVTDADGDGDMDLVALDIQSDDLRVTMQEGGVWIDPEDDDDEYEFAPSLQASNFQFEGRAACFADVNGDGLMDIVAQGDGDLDGDIRWAFGFYLAPFSEDDDQEVALFGIPDFENQYSDEYSNPENEQRSLRSVGDLDGDGVDDLLYFPLNQNPTGWRISDPLNLNGRRAVYSELGVHGEGVYSIQSEREYDRFVYRDAMVDLNGDGVKDRVTPTVAERFDYSFEDFEEQLGLTVWGVLANPMKRDVVFEEQDAFGRYSLSHVIAADFDGDGDPEILGNDNGFRVFDRDVDGRYKWDRDTVLIGGPRGFRTVIAQMDDDPTPDVLSLQLVSGSNAPSCFLNPVMSGFEGERIVNRDMIQEQELHSVLDEMNINFNSEDSSFSTGDVDGDGTTDIVIRGDVDIDEGYRGEAVLVWLNDGSAQFSLGPISPIGELEGLRTYNMELIDANQDEMLDVVCVVVEDDTGEYAIETYLNDGSGGFTLDQSLLVEDLFHLDAYWIVIEDVDGDGMDDVSVLFKNDEAEHEVVIAYGGEDGLEEQLHRWAGGNAAEIVVADLDGDGMKDLLSCSYENTSGEFTNSVSVMFQGAAREFGPMVSIADVDLSGINVADLDSDGGVDLIACTNGSNDPRVVRVYYGIDEVCRADMNFDGSLNYLDIALFVKLVGEGREAADLDRDAVFGIDDISLFLDLYMNSCD